MGRGLFDDVIANLLLAMPEQEIVLGEVGMAKYVRGDQRVFLKAVVMC
jgi:hypothetical protein